MAVFLTGLAIGYSGCTRLALAFDGDASVGQAASDAGVDPVELLGAVNSTGLEPYTYLRSVGELPPLKTLQTATVRNTPVSTSPVVECIIARESHGNPNARNPTSGASGLGQFLPSTWRTTPQGRAGYSVFDPVANRAAVAWMVSVGRGSEFVTIWGCR